MFVLETTGSATRMSVVLAAGPALEHGDPSLAWLGIAAVQSVAALLFARSALLFGSERPLPSWRAG